MGKVVNLRKRALLGTRSSSDVSLCGGGTEYIVYRVTLVRSFNNKIRFTFCKFTYLFPSKKRNKNSSLLTPYIYDFQAGGSEYLRMSFSRSTFYDPPDFTLFRDSCKKKATIPVENCFN